MDQWMGIDDMPCIEMETTRKGPGLEDGYEDG